MNNIDAIAIQQTPEQAELAKQYRLDQVVMYINDFRKKNKKAMVSINTFNGWWSVYLDGNVYQDDNFTELADKYLEVMNG